MPTCPSQAIYFGDLNDKDSKISKAMTDAEAADGDLKQLRPEKGTEPRMWFAGEGTVHLEDRVPKEGESYSPGAYNIHGWKEAKP